MKLLMFLILALFCLPKNSQSQIEYSLVSGKKYKVTLTNKQEITGSFVKQDSNTISFNSENILMTIRKNNILKISGDISSDNYKFITTIFGGIIPRFNDIGRYYSNKSSFLLSFSTSYFLSENKNIGIELTYSPLRKSPYSYNNSLFSGGERSFYNIILSGEFGNFKKSNKFDFYFKAGAGFHNEHTNSGMQIYNSFLADTNYFSSSDYFYLIFQTGGGIIYKFSNNIGLNAEIDINAYGFNVNSLAGYLQMKAGMAYYFMK